MQTNIPKETLTTPINSPHYILFKDEEINSNTSYEYDYNIIDTSTLQNFSNLPKNMRFKNHSNYKYNLRSTKTTNQNSYLITQHLFNIQAIANHIYRDNRK